jgi:hypothetical protein
MDGLLVPCSGVGCDNLATTNVSDYPNKGVGLKQGYFYDSVVTETQICEGVDPGGDMNGRYVCSTCSHVFYRHNLIDNVDGCADSLVSDLRCSFCPGYISSEATDFTSLRDISLFFFLTTLFQLSSSCCLRTPKNGRKDRKEAQAGDDSSRVRYDSYSR